LEKACSLRITLRNSGLAILSAVHAVTAVAVVTRSPGSAAIAFSPKKLLDATKRIVASFPVEERTEILARPLVQVEDAIGWISLRKEGLRAVQLDDPSSRPAFLRYASTSNPGLLTFAIGGVHSQRSLVEQNRKDKRINSL